MPGETAFGGKAAALVLRPGWGNDQDIIVTIAITGSLFATANRAITNQLTATVARNPPWPGRSGCCDSHQTFDDPSHAQPASAEICGHAADLPSRELRHEIAPRLSALFRVAFTYR
jgi:hypothetical protein